MEINPFSTALGAMAGNVNHAKQLQLNVSTEIQTHSPIEEFQYSQIVMEATYSKLLLLPHKKQKVVGFLQCHGEYM